MRIRCAMLGRIKSSAFEVTVEPTDTVATVKAKFLSNMSLITTLALTDDAPRSRDRDAWALLLGETRLAEGDTLSACGVEENTLLSLVVAASTGAQ